MRQFDFYVETSYLTL